MLNLYVNIKNERLKKGWTQTELAHKVGYSDKSMIAKIESGKVDLPQTKIRAFANVFNCSESYLMGLDGVLENEPEILFTDDEIKLIVDFRHLDDESKRQLILMMSFLKEQQSNK